MKNTKKMITESKRIPSAVAPIIKNADNKLCYGGKRAGAYRIQRTNPEVAVSAQEILSIIRLSGIKVIKRIPPGKPGAASGKFNTWVFHKDGTTFSVVFGQGSNKGQHYEDKFLQKLQNSLKGKTSSGDNLLTTLLATLGIKPSEIKEIKKASSRQVKRPITDKVENVGSVISDITIVKKNGDEVYISLKNKNGVTFANGGYSGSFQVVQSGRSKKMKIVPGSHPLDDFIVNALGVDKKQAAEGLTAYLNSEPQTIKKPYQKVATKFNKAKLKKYLASAFGYGYWYVRQTKDGGHQIFNIATPADAVKLIGNIKAVIVNYPHYVAKSNKQGSSIIKSSKQITAWIETTMATYIVEVRNSHRGVEPNEIKVKVMGLKV